MTILYLEALAAIALSLLIVMGTHYRAQSGGLAKNFDSRRDETEPVLRDVSASFVRGQVCVLLGPSGSGKTTLLSILGCMLKPTDGELTICGERVDWRRCCGRILSGF